MREIPIVTSENLVRALSDLLLICKDNVVAYEHIANHTPYQDLRKLCQQFANKRYDFSRELNEMVVRYTPTGQQDETLYESVRHHEWRDIPSHTNFGREVICRLCVRGEQANMESYQRAREYAANYKVDHILKIQHEQIEEAYHWLQEMKFISAGQSQPY